MGEDLTRPRRRTIHRAHRGGGLHRRPAQPGRGGEPRLAGAAFAAGHQELPLVACGALKILYDLALLAAFRHIKPLEER